MDATARTATVPNRLPIDLLLVRHGHSEGNRALDAAKTGDDSWMTEEYRARSTADYRLTDDGRAQAARAGDWLRGWLDRNGLVDFDRHYCSPYIRTRETAAHLDLPAAQWRLEPLLRERDWGLWEGRGRGETNEAYPDSTRLKKRNKYLWRPECGESTPDMDLRVRELLATLAREMEGRRVVCVTHEDVMWAFRARLEKMPMEHWLEVEDADHEEIRNCGILHYTRIDSDGSVGDRLQRVRRIDPVDGVVGPWQEILRPRFSNAELLGQVREIEELRQRCDTQ